MSMSLEELDNLLLEFLAAAQADNVDAMERILTMEAVQQHIRVNNNARLLRNMAESGYAAAVNCLIKFNLVHGQKILHLKCALRLAIQHEHLEVVKLLAPICDQFNQSLSKLRRYDDHDYEMMLPQKVTDSNLEMIKFLLKVPTIKMVLGRIGDGQYFLTLLTEAVMSGHLEIIESLLEVEQAGICLHRVTKAINGSIAGHTNGVQLAANRNYLAIAFCLADKITSTPILALQEYWGKFFSGSSYEKFIVYGFERFIIQIADQPVSIGNFLYNYEKDMVLKLSSFNSAIQELNTHLLSPLTTLIMHYLGRLENVPSKFMRSVTVCSSIIPSVQQASGSTVASSSSTVACSSWDVPIPSQAAIQASATTFGIPLNFPIPAGVEAPAPTMILSPQKEVSTERKSPPPPPVKPATEKTPAPLSPKR